MNFRQIDLKRDKDTLIAFRRDTYIQSFGTDEDFDGDEYLKRMRVRVDRFPDGQVFLEDGQTPVGQVGIHTRDFAGKKIGYINLFYLTPTYRGKGVGINLVQFAEDYFKLNGVSEYHLSVSARNRKAIRFYEKIGMEQVDEDEHLVRMRKLVDGRRS